jgi:hypothetical protein
MSWTLSRKRRPQDGRRVQLRHAGEVAVAEWHGDRWQLQTGSAALRDLALHHGWSLAAPESPRAGDADKGMPTQQAAPAQPAQEPPAPEAAPAGLAAQAQALVQGTVDDVELALREACWHSEAALQAVLQAEAAAGARKGVRRAVARARRQMQAS